MSCRKIVFPRYKWQEEDEAGEDHHVWYALADIADSLKRKQGKEFRLVLEQAGLGRSQKKAWQYLTAACTRLRDNPTAKL